MKKRHLLLAAGLLLAAAQAAAAAGPPCRPCAGIRLADPGLIAEAMSADPRVEGEARLYVAWPAELDGSADLAAFETVRRFGGTPWMAVRFRTPPPIRQHLEQLEIELEELARLAGGAGERAHFQIEWEPEGGAEPTDLAFLIKRAAVAITGARADARVLAGPLAPDPEMLRTLYGEEVQAYLDGLALEPGDGLPAARALVAELDPGKPVTLDALPWPEEDARTLALAAEYATAGFGVTFFDLQHPASADLAPLKLLAREFQGDLSFDPATRPQGAERAWTFVRGEDLALRVIAETETPGERLPLYFDDPQLKSPASVDLASGEEQPVYGQYRTNAGLGVPIDEPGPVVLLRLERMSAEELAGVEERLEIEDRRQMPVEEILRQLQAFEDDQARRLDHYQAKNIFHLRFQSGPASIQAAYEGDFFFQRGEGFDWVWDSFYVDGVKWKGKKLPEIPLLQPEKAAALPLEILLTKEYSYRLRGTAVVDGRDAWVIDFRPLGDPAPGRSLYQGTVWVDREIYARVKTRAIQLGLEGDVISNEETTTFTPVDAAGRPAPWARDPSTFFLPTRVLGQQIVSVLNAAVPIELATELSEIRVNGADFAAAREEAWASEATMVRDTDQGLRYLRKDRDGERYVEEEVDTDRLFLVGGVFWDESVDFPLPLVGINYLALDWRGTGNQLNLFFAGPLVTLNLAEPRLFGSRWDAGFNLFGFFIDTGDELYRDGQEVPAEEIESRGAAASFFVGRPLGSFGKLDFTYRLGQTQFSRADDTAEDFVLPTDTLTQSFLGELQYNRGGYRFAVQGSLHRRDDWDFWGVPRSGVPGSADFSPVHQDYVRWRASLAKNWWFAKFRNFGLQIEHLDGSDLDRFSRYDFGIFGDSSVAGYQGGLVRADQATGLHLGYGLNAADVFRFEIEGDAVWATNEETGLDRELLAGVGLEGSLTLPWNLLTNFEVGIGVAGPGKGDLAVRMVFLKLFPEGWKFWGRKKKGRESGEPAATR